MKTKISCIVALFIFVAIVVFAGNKTEKFKVYGNCEMCKARIETAAKSVDGVTAADWDVKTKMIALTYDDSKTDVNKVQQAIAKVGHDTDKYKATDEAYNKIADCCKFERVKSDLKKDLKKDMKIDLDKDVEMDEKLEDVPMK